MFSAVETKTLITIFITSTIMLMTAQAWGAGGLITTAFAAYAITGALLYALMSVTKYLSDVMLQKWRSRRSTGS